VERWDRRGRCHEQTSKREARRQGISSMISAILCSYQSEFLEYLLPDEYLSHHHLTELGQLSFVLAIV
jgi:hypothetical protein